MYVCQHTNIHIRTPYCDPKKALIQTTPHSIPSNPKARFLACHLASSKNLVFCHKSPQRKRRGGVFFAPFFFFGARFFFVGGWCRLELCHFCKLWREKTRISAKFRVLQPNTAQHSFWGLGFCNPTLLLGLKVLQPNIPFRA